MDIDKLYLEYCGHNPEEVTWEFRNCMKYKIFHDAANIVIAEMKKTCGGCCNGEEIGEQSGIRPCEISMGK